MTKSLLCKSLWDSVFRLSLRSSPGQCLLFRSRFLYLRGCLAVGLPINRSIHLGPLVRGFGGEEDPGTPRWRGVGTSWRATLFEKTKEGQRHLQIRCFFSSRWGRSFRRTVLVTTGNGRGGRCTGKIEESTGSQGFGTVSGGPGRRLGTGVVTVRTRLRVRTGTVGLVVVGRAEGVLLAVGRVIFQVQ